MFVVGKAFQPSLIFEILTGQDLKTSLKFVFGTRAYSSGVSCRCSSLKVGSCGLFEIDKTGTNGLAYSSRGSVTEKHFYNIFIFVEFKSEEFLSSSFREMAGPPSGKVESTNIRKQTFQDRPLKQQIPS